MAIRLMEGFEPLPNPGGFFGYGTHLGEKGWSGSTNVGLEPGRPTLSPYSSAVKVLFANGITKIIPGGGFTDGVLGFAFKYPGPGAFGLIHNFIASGSFTVGLNDLFLLYVQDQGGHTWTGTTPIYSNVWYYCEVRVVGNVMELHLDGGSIPEIGPVSGTFGTFVEVNLVPQAIDGGDMIYDDIYVVDTTTAFNNDFLGDCHVETLYPTEDGFYHDWSPSAGTDHWAMVDEEHADGDATYVFDSNVGDKDTYVMDDLTMISGDVFAAQLNLYARKSQAGTREAKALIRLSGTDYLYPTPLPFGVSYRYLSYLYNTNPTGAAWTASAINAAEAGMELST